MIKYSDLIELYNEAVNVVTRYNYPDDASLEHRVEVERSICQRRLGMIHPDSSLGQTVSREQLAKQYHNIIRIYGQDPNPHRKKPAA